MALTYKASGVSIEAGNSFVKKLAPIVKTTFSERVICDIGGFGALFDGSFPEMKNPVLVSGTDGVGTKLKIAQMMDKHDTIGIDAVAMCVNDILVSGAQPLFFLDYISCGRLRENVMVDIIKGLAEGCRQSGASLIGGETAEHPGLMPDEEYDIAGFSVGVVDREKIIDGSKINPGDVIIGLPSSGVHSNGFSLVRKLFLEMKKYSLTDRFEDLGSTIGEELVKPTYIYCKQVLALIKAGISIKGMVHITGGGFYENIPRILPEGTAAYIDKNSFTVLPVFKMIQREGGIEEKEMFTTFNMGIGLMIIADKAEADKIITELSSSGIKSSVIGEIKASPTKEAFLR